MNLETIALVKHSREHQTAKALLQYMINESQQSRLAQKDFGRVPMNKTVKLDARILPNLGAISNEGRHALIFPLNLPVVEAFEGEIDAIQRDFLEGLISPEQAGQRIYTTLQTSRVTESSGEEQ